MALKFGAQQFVAFEAMENAFPVVVGDLARKMLSEARPDWETVTFTVHRDDVFRPDTWVVRLYCQGGRRNCQVRGG